MTIMIDPDTREELDRLALMRGVSTGAITREVIEFGLDVVRRRTVAMEKIKK